MKIVLSTFGSRGDVQPMLALSLALLNAGHDAVLAGPPEKAAWAAELGCPYRPLGSDLTALVDSVDRADSLSAAVKFIRFVRKEIDQQFEELPPILAGADLAIGASLCFGLSSVAEAMAIPYRYIAFSPQILPSIHHPFPVVRHQRLPGWCNRMSWRMRHWLDRFNLTLIINRRRRQFGLGPIDDCWTHVLGSRVVVASDRALAGIPPDAAGRGAVQTAYMHLRQPHLEFPGLDSFIEKGPPPVYSGFGSMPKPDQDRLVPLVVSAARSAGQRVVVTRFGESRPEKEAMADVFFIRRYPHRRLFPRMAAIIHHGGSGTTATAAISGVPQIVVPHLLDQYYWGDRVHRAGLGPEPVWRSRLSGEKLAKAISICLSQVGFQRNAKNIQESIRKDNGVELTVGEILK